MRCKIPEGPEVRRITDQLHSHFAGKVIADIEIISGRYTRHGAPAGFSEFKSTLEHQIKEVSCHGKFIFFKLEDDWTIWCTLGMTGGWSINEDKHSRVKFTMTDETVLYFSDVRNQGTIKFVRSYEELYEKIRKMGPDVLKGFLLGHLLKAVKSTKKKTVVEMLMDQSKIAGVGNYLKAEILYMAKISPWRTCDTLSMLDMENIHKAIIDRANESYKTGGATLKNYKDIQGNAGTFSGFFKVYSKKSDPAGRIVIREETPDGRTTHWVPEIQM